MKAIADQLGVTKILEGGVQRAGDRVRINVQLIDAATDAHLWAETYDRELTAANIFAIQSEVAAAIADALKATLTPAEQARADSGPDAELEAWEAYQLGKQRMAKRTARLWRKPKRIFQKAIDARSEVRAAGGIGGHANAAVQSTAPTERTSESSDAEKTVVRALELDPNLAEAWALLLASRRPVQQVRSEPMFRRAIELNPSYAPAHQWRA